MITLSFFLEIAAACSAAGLIHELQKGQKIWAPLMGACLVINVLGYFAIIH